MRQSGILAVGVGAVLAPGGPPLAGRAEQAPAAATAAGPFDSLHFRPIGPASMSGRIADVAVYEADPNIF